MTVSEATTHARPKELYRLDQEGRRVIRTIKWGRRSRSTACEVSDGMRRMDDADKFDWLWLRQSTRPLVARPRGIVRIADLFSGCGQMSVGISEAARALGLESRLVLAVDADESAVRVCRRTFPEADVRKASLEQLLDSDPFQAASKNEKALAEGVGEIDVLVGGPPCQGHSNLNNHTRRRDNRNALAHKMVRFAELVRPSHVVLENVRGIVHDHDSVFQEVQASLERLGYRTAPGVLRAEECGVAQRRHRMFLVATLSSGMDVASALALPVIAERTFAWACGDLDNTKSDDNYDQPPSPTPRSRRRIDYLFNEACHELPDSQRPPCHRRGGHSYKSIYGRLWWDRPAQTITTGFRCMGQGRFVHPKRRRTITPHEAARLQFIPDFVDFSGLRPTAVARLIGNAVPPKLLSGIGLALLAEA